MTDVIVVNPPGIRQYYSEVLYLFHRCWLAAAYYDSMITIPVMK